MDAKIEPAVDSGAKRAKSNRQHFPFHRERERERESVQALFRSRFGAEIDDNLRKAIWCPKPPPPEARIYRLFFCSFLCERLGRTQEACVYFIFKFNFYRPPHRTSLLPAICASRSPHRRTVAGEEERLLNKEILFYNFVV